MWFRTLLNRRIPRRNASHSRRAAPRRCRLAVEALEDRRVPAAVLSVWDSTVLEGNAGTQNAAVTVTLSEPHSNAVSVNYRTADGTAIAGSDYNAVSGTLNFTKNQMSKTILVPVIGDRVPEPDKYFFVRLDSSKAGARIVNGQAVVTILDDEPRVSINSVYLPEGNDGSTTFRFTVSLSTPYNLPVTVDYATVNGSAIAGADYTSASGTVTFPAGETSQNIDIVVNGNRVANADKTFSVSLSNPSIYAAIATGVGVGTILDDEPRIYISDAYQNYGESTITFTVSLSAAYDQNVTVDFATADGTALAGVDYVTTFGTLTFDSSLGETTKTITVNLLDTTSSDKYFSVHLSNASTNALIAYDTAYGYWYYDYGYYDYCCYDYYDYYYYW